ncbi:hypothetical protein [Priestia megaterium]|uniref:Uncharacterized protein n=1 Tax=Priestia megaterium TaxID=1404 RepID=A0A6M6E020_PRIMG|nr:hypothetical protein [Priestia megaterium]QJX80190.1 hypothetical protein FDZ14_29270 [Priestia megaterium]
MKKLLLFLLCTVVTLSGCSTFNEETAKKNVEQEINNFYNNLLMEDIDAVMKQVSTDSEQYYNLYDNYRDIFQKYNYSYQLKEISYDQVSKDIVVASVSLTVSGVNRDQEYDSYDVVQTFTFKSVSDKKWKITAIDDKYDFK